MFAPNHRLRKAVTALAIGNLGKRSQATACGHGGDGDTTGGCCDANPRHKPRSHDTSRKSVGKTHGQSGGRVSAGVPSVRQRYPADRMQTSLRVRNHPWPSHSWQPPVAADFLSASRGRSGRSSRTWASRWSLRPSRRVRKRFLTPFSLKGPGRYNLGWVAVRPLAGGAESGSNDCS